MSLSEATLYPQNDENRQIAFNHLQLSSLGPSTQIAQLRWHNVANVGMVAVGTPTLAQRRHGRRWHNYVGATSPWSPLAQLRWRNVI